MKQTKVMLFLAFIFCMSFSVNSTAALIVDSGSTEKVIKTDILSKKNIKKQLRKNWKTIKSKLTDIKHTLKEKAENVSSGKLLLIGIVGLLFILLGAILNIANVGGLFISIGGILIVVAVVLWVLQVLIY